MSRLGKKKILIPTGVNVSVDGSVFVASGPLGSLSLNLHPNVSLDILDTSITVSVSSKDVPGLHGLFRALLSNLVVGVSEGFTKKLDLFGVGYRAALSSGNLQLSLGFSHPVVFPAPDGISFKVEGSQIFVVGINKQLVGEVASQIYRLRPADSYKGKGVRISSVVRLKPGKSGRK